jgi:5-oxoprolinase (ATP-hydrolysing)
MKPGDVYMLNAPYNGGTHLPDITVITPVFDEAGGPSCSSSARAATTPISAARRRAPCRRTARASKEGVLIDNFLLVEHGVLREAETRALLGSGPYPAAIRSESRRSARPDRGQRNRRARTEEDGRPLRPGRGLGLHGPCPGQRRGVRCAASSTCSRTDRSTTKWTTANTSRSPSPSTVHSARATIDFTGTSKQHPGNFNAPRRCAKAAVLYVFRTLVDDDIPLNEGCLKPSTSSFPTAACCAQATRRRWSPATSKPRSAVTDACTARWGCWRRPRGP